jgi:hypothetical protein
MPAAPGVVFKVAALGRKPACQFTRVQKYNITVVSIPVNTAALPGFFLLDFFPGLRLCLFQAADRALSETTREFSCQSSFPTPPSLPAASGPAFTGLVGPVD